jgi:serine/threonine-protein kinase
LGAPWLKLAAFGERPTGGGPPSGPPGTETPLQLRWFLMQMDLDVACFVGDVPAALAALERLDAAGCHHTGYLERCTLLAPVRAAPESQPFRRRIAERAARIVAAYRER